MNSHAILRKARYNSLQSLAFGIMCLLTLACIAMAILFDPYQDRIIRLVKISNVLGLVFLTLLSGFLLSRAGKDSEPKRYLTLFLVNIHAAALFSTLMYSLWQVPGCSSVLTMLCTICYFLMMLFFPTLWLYLRQFIKNTIITRIVTVLLYGTVAIYAALLIANLHTPILFSYTEQGVASTDVRDYTSIILTTLCLVLLSVATVSSDMSTNRKLSFFCCIITPLLFSMLIVNQHLLSWGVYYNVGIVSLTVLLPLCVALLNTHDELENDVLRHEKEQIQLQVSAMISQMQPHFLYNSLAVIAALCEEDPKLAAEATNTFSNYLRENMDFADKSDPVSFSEELSHIETYVWLEKLRFPNKLGVTYDIASSGFLVPALSVQPIVENAIKHGICKSKTGGTVTIRSFETDWCHCVAVTDDGIGFDVKAGIDDGQRHLGIENSRYRLQEMVGGTLEIESTPGEGTTVTIVIPKRAGK